MVATHYSLSFYSGPLTRGSDQTADCFTGWSNTSHTYWNLLLRGCGRLEFDLVSTVAVRLAITDRTVPALLSSNYAIGALFATSIISLA